MQFLLSGTLALHYSAVALDAAKPVIVFINSLGTDFRIWDDVMAELGDGYAFVLHDKRGHGLSDVGATPYSIDDHVNDLEALLDHLDVKHAIIWGLSVGGLIAQRLYARRPDLVRALVLSNTAHKIGTAEMWNDRIGHIEREGIAPLVDGVMERWFTPAFRSPENVMYLGARTMLAQQNKAGYAATCAAIRDADYTEQATKIFVPTLCVAGDGDKSTPPDLVHTLSSLIQGCRTAIIEDCGHIPCLEQPGAYAAVVDHFLKSLPEF
ncbi:3-oxoadipate enol-lactonase [Rhizobium skierniewicense]|uniref:3-oxoadipate enol-lactonase n=1 Tax=Rhizobium skierniewicense TaxID=984260 RepID=UPI001574C2BD|nr:3-oxoadipate enol-lactonase [Rhizobium skierniewicense]NTF33762.1 3-oxoadipate enol-lactonase [Rhizobium skierniewicense]